MADAESVLAMPKLIDLECKGSKDGYLVPLEGGSEVVPFDIKRVYYIHGVGDGLRRGFHAHKALKQLIIAVNGRCTIDLDDTLSRQSYVLERPDQGLLICQPTWREMYDFSRDCVLMVLASEHYDPDDYIWSFHEFKAFLENQSQS